MGKKFVIGDRLKDEWIIQETGYFSDLQIYMKEDNKAYKIDERDSFQS